MKQLEIHVNRGALEKHEAMEVGLNLFAAFGQALQRNFEIGKEIVERNPRPTASDVRMVPSKFIRFEFDGKTVHVKFKKDEGSTVVVEEKGG